MIERPIIFSGPMVRAILEDRKIQTRRIVKRSERYEHIRDCDFCCPLGVVGDRLWVRETWWAPLGVFDLGEVAYREIVETAGREEATKRQVWKSPLFMPRWASRITLEITVIQVQRLQEITEEDAIAEGMSTREETGFDTPRYRFHVFWDSLNAKRGYGWETNPWVWAISFKVILPAQREGEG